MRPKLDQAIERFGSRQHGVVSLGQLYRAGATRSAVRHRVSSGRLHRVHRGVFAVGRADLSREGQWKAATLALGGDAVLSHRSAAELWGLLATMTHPIDLSVDRTGRVHRDGIRLHRSTSLTASIGTLRNGIPVTRPERTLTDLRRVTGPAEYRDAIRAAEIAGLPVGDHGKRTDRTRSELELAFLSLLRRHRLPRPEVNVRVGRFLVDFLWAAQRLVAETDGHRFHRGHLATADDRARDAELRTLGFDVLRFSYSQVCKRPDEVAKTLRVRLRA
jgi:very-short-patch-repair endonuclease